MTEKNGKDQNFCRQLRQLTEVKLKKQNSIEREICKGQINVSTITKVSSALLRTANPG